MKRVLIAAALGMTLASRLAAAAPLQTEVQSFLTAWTGGPVIEPGAVERFYAPRVTYYGRAETRAQVLSDKRALARRWPHRLYRVLPGSASAHCNDAQTRCQVSAVLDWRAESPGRGARSGAATVRLDLVRDGAVLKIVRESGGVIARRRLY